MRLHAFILTFTLCAAPAFADIPANVTLVIENDAGMVTQLRELTQRECDAISALLSPRKSQNAGLMISSGSSSYILGGVPMAETKPLTSRLTTARCMTEVSKQP